MTGKIKFTAASTADFTQNKEYAIVSFVGDSSSLLAVVVDDNGNVATANPSGGQWNITELWAAERVI